MIYSFKYSLDLYAMYQCIQQSYIGLDIYSRLVPETSLSWRLDAILRTTEAESDEDILIKRLPCHHDLNYSGEI